MVIPSMVSCDFGNRDEEDRSSSDDEDNESDSNEEDDKSSSDDEDNVSNGNDEEDDSSSDDEEDDSGSDDEEDDSGNDDEEDDSSNDDEEDRSGMTGNSSLSESPEQPTRPDNAAARKHATTSCFESAQISALLCSIPFIPCTNIKKTREQQSRKKAPEGGLQNIPKVYKSITTTESPVSGSYSAGGVSIGSLSLGLDGSGAGPRSTS